MAAQSTTDINTAIAGSLNRRRNTIDDTLSSAPLARNSEKPLVQRHYWKPASGSVYLLHCEGSHAHPSSVLRAGRIAGPRVAQRRAADLRPGLSGRKTRRARAWRA